MPSSNYRDNFDKGDLHSGIKTKTETYLYKVIYLNKLYSGRYKDLRVYCNVPVGEAVLLDSPRALPGNRGSNTEVEYAGKPDNKNKI